MAGKPDDHAQGLAERSVNTSIVPPTSENSGHRPRDEGSASERRANRNEQREGMERTDPKSHKQTPHEA
jgi:hypothetical protein